MNSVQQLISIYKENQHTILELKQVLDELHDQNQEERRKTFNKYHTKFIALEEEQDQELNKLETKQDQELNKLETKIQQINSDYDKKISELNIPISDTKRIIYFLNQSKVKLNFDVNKTTNRYGHLELIQECYDVDLILVSYIAENDRPKNKYSLVIVGMCRFGDHNNSKILKLPYDYKISLYHDAIQWWSIEKEVKVFDSINSAKKYHKSNKIENIFKDFFTEYHTIKQEYLKAITTYTLDDFAEIIKND